MKKMQFKKISKTQKEINRHIKFYNKALPVLLKKLKLEGIEMKYSKAKQKVILRTYRCIFNEPLIHETPIELTDGLDLSQLEEIKRGEESFWDINFVIVLCQKFTEDEVDGWMFGEDIPNRELLDREAEGIHENSTKFLEKLN